MVKKSVSLDIGKSMDWKELSQKSNAARFKHGNAPANAHDDSQSIEIISYDTSKVSTSDSDRRIASRSYLDDLMEGTEPAWLSRQDSPLLLEDDDTPARQPRKKRFILF